MKCVCISCFDHYNTRMNYITRFFRKKGFKTYYIIADYLHFEKKYGKKNYTGVINVHVPKYIKNMSINRLYSHYCFAKKTYKLLEKIRPDVIYCMFPPNMLVRECAIYKKKHKNVGLVFDCYDAWPESMTIQSKLLKIPFAVWRCLRDRYIEYADKTIVVSEYGKKWIKRLHPRLKVEVLYPRLDKRPVVSYKTDTSEAVSFCYLGNINYITDTELIIQLLTRVIENKKTILHHIGSGQNLNDFVKTLKEKGISVILHGPVFDTEEKEKIFSCCNWGINFPKKEVQSSMALKSVEYMRSGLPVLNSGVGDNWDIVRKNSIGFNCSAKNVEKIADIITSLNEDDYKRFHDKTVNCYNRLFGEPDYKQLFHGVCNIFEE